MKWNGLDELRESLRHLPETLKAEAAHIVEGAANGAEVDMRAGYPAGELRDGVRVTHFSGGKFSAGAIVKSTSKLAWLYENGSEARHYVTVRGNRHLTGKMPAKHVFIPAAMRARRRMYQQLKEMLQRQGLKVSGDA